MIAADQPTIFPKDLVLTAISSVEDGSMKDGEDLLTHDAVSNRRSFLAGVGAPVEQAAVFFATFDTDDFCRYKEARAGLMSGIDAVTVDKPGTPILLPLADCTGAIIYDPTHHVLMVSHLGRHSTEQQGAARSVEHLQEHYDSKSEELLVWLSPSPSSDSYPLWAFANRSFRSVLGEQFAAAGVLPGHIEVNEIDTTSSSHYFSHSQFLRGQQEVDGRYAIVAMLL